MQKSRQWENADQDAWQLALEREAVIRPLAEQVRLSPTLVQDATRQLRLSRSVLYDLLRRTNSGRRLLHFCHGREAVQPRLRSWNQREKSC